MVSVPAISTHNIEAQVIAASENYFIYYDGKSKSEGLLNICYYPSMSLYKSLVSHIQSFPKVHQLEICQGYLIVITTALQVYSLPDVSLISSSKDCPQCFAIDKQEIATLDGTKISLFSLSSLTLLSEHEIKSECRRLVLISGQGILLQSRSSLNYFSFTKGESLILDLKRAGLKGIFSLQSPLSSIIHIQQYSLLCITTNNSSFFLDYSFKTYSRYPMIKHTSEPLQIAFIHPCFLCSFSTNLLSIYLTYTAELLENITIPSLSYEICCSSFHSHFIASSNSLFAVSSPSLDVLVPSLLIKKKFDIALELCNDTCSNLLTRVYFEYAVFMFFQERDYQRSAHYFRKSEELWAVCSLLRKMLQLPAFVYMKCEEYFDKACERISGFSVLPSHFDFISQRQPLLYDSALRQRIIHHFTPFFHMARKVEDDSLRLYSECWLFCALLYLPNQSGELLPIVRDPMNKLPLRFCENQLKAANKLDLLFELFLSRKIYKPALDIMMGKFLEDKSQYWMIKMKDFLMRINRNIELFIEYIQKMFCESPKIAEELLLGYPEILSKADVLKVLVPIILKFSGPGLVIKFLSGRSSLEESNYLAKLYIEEIMEGRVNPRDLVNFLSYRPTKYDPNIVLKYFPKHALQREKCLVLDLLEKHEEIIHYYIYTEKNLEAAKQYVAYKRSKDVTSLFIMKICKAPMTQAATDTLISFLNNADPTIIDHNIAYTFIPHTLNISQISLFLFKAAHSFVIDKKNLQINKNLQENLLLSLLSEYYKHAEDSTEILEDTRCDKCNKKIKTSDFVVSKSKEILHTKCYEAKY